MIYISAGHHSEKRGACFQNFCEYPETARWADKIVILLGKHGERVPNGYLRAKAGYINRRCADGRGIAAEIHFNAAVDDKGHYVGRGSESLHFPGSAGGILAAREVQARLSHVFPPDRGVKAGWYRMDPRNGVDFFLREIRAPAIIVEPEFIHRKDEIIANADLGCEAIAEGLLAAHEQIFGL